MDNKGDPQLISKVNPTLHEKGNCLVGTVQWVDIFFEVIVCCLFVCLFACLFICLVGCLFKEELASGF